MPRYTRQPGYPLPSYTEHGNTTDAEHCPSCGNDDIDLLRGFTSGQAIGLCDLCCAYYVVEPTPAAAEQPVN